MTKLSYALMAGVLALLASITSAWAQQDCSKWDDVGYWGLVITAEEVDSGLKNGCSADVVFKTHNNISPLHVLASSTRPDAVEIINVIAQNGGDLTATQSDFYLTPMQIALKEARFDVIQTFLAQGVDINHRSQKGWGIVHASVAVGNTDLIDDLQTLGADINARDNLGGTPICM